MQKEHLGHGNQTPNTTQNTTQYYHLVLGELQSLLKVFLN